MHFHIISNLKLLKLNTLLATIAHKSHKSVNSDADEMITAD